MTYTEFGFCRFPESRSGDRMLFFEVFLERNMKIMKCRDLGGTCDQKLSADTWEEMIKVITKHVLDKHPDVAKQMEKMHNEDPKKWAKEMKPKWEAAPAT
jgi:predicted small metal-binding protein